MKNQLGDAQAEHFDTFTLHATIQSRILERPYSIRRYRSGGTRWRRKARRPKGIHQRASDQASRRERYLSVQPVVPLLIALASSAKSPIIAQIKLALVAKRSPRRTQ
ncbi:hypothetical protein BV898_19832 [Hypsibius exemplaris]|uniref:Uncharacterized protein n=1 Tax=Hypsibius exemplaris TaxID=2072580 RepID=A0A9X6RQ01_HYPEX|nr:hypothetical protein BV898_19832 [Hypsibius exemplaris]